jgi:hypothetical protein
LWDQALPVAKASIRKQSTALHSGQKSKDKKEEAAEAEMLRKKRKAEDEAAKKDLTTMYENDHPSVSTSLGSIGTTLLFPLSHMVFFIVHVFNHLACLTAQNHTDQFEMYVCYSLCFSQFQSLRSLIMHLIRLL